MGRFDILMGRDIQQKEPREKVPLVDSKTIEKFRDENLQRTFEGRRAREWPREFDGRWAQEWTQEYAHPLPEIRLTLPQGSQVRLPIENVFIATRRDRMTHGTVQQLQIDMPDNVAELVRSEMDAAIPQRTLRRERLFRSPSDGWGW